MFGKKFVAFVEDNESALAAFQRELGDSMISARTVVEFETELWPQRGNIVVWFLDVEIPRAEGAVANARNGINIAKVLAKEMPNIPRFCISARDDLPDWCKEFYSGHILKSKVEEIIQKAKEYL